MNAEINELDNNIDKQIVCNKGNMNLYSRINNQNKLKEYELEFNIDSINPDKINIENLLSHNIYELIEKINTDLVEKIILLNVFNEDKADILILLKHIAKEIGIKQKYLLFRSNRKIDYINDKIVFTNKDIALIDNNLANEYLKSINYNISNFEALIFNYGTIEIKIFNVNLQELSNNKNNENLLIDSKFNTTFQIVIKDYLPIYMENLVGLMIKKLFYNLKQFIDNLK